VVDALPQGAWQTVTWREGSHDPTGATGTLCKQFVAVRVHRATGGAPLPVTDRRVRTGPEGWLLGERPLPGHAGERKYSVSSLPADTPLPRLVELAQARWASEQFYEEAKGECGLDDYQGRGRAAPASGPGDAGLQLPGRAGRAGRAGPARA
jgi:SRSO17 transposase